MCSAAATVLPMGALTTATPGPRGGVQVDVIDSDAGAGDHLQVVAGGNYRLGYFGLATHHQRVVSGDGSDEFVGRKAALDVNGNVLFQ